MNNSALRIVRQGGLTALLALAACAQYPNGTVPTVETITMSSAVQEAAKHYPPLFLGGNVRPSDGSIPLSCPKAGGVVEQRGGPTMEYFGADPSDPDLCVMRVGGEMVKAWYGIWVTAWPGAENARPALRQIFHGKTGDVTGFDTNMMVGLQFHDLIRNEGVEGHSAAWPDLPCGQDLPLPGRIRRQRLPFGQHRLEGRADRAADLWDVSAYFWRAGGG
ncbi:MAG: hypothetical protein WDN49_14280 [Acetobacteraceae bacterium]